MLANFNLSDLYIFSPVGLVTIFIIAILSTTLINYRKNQKGAELIERLKQLDNNTYRLISNVNFKSSDLKIDHIVLSTYGIFIIQRYHFTGVLSGTRSDQNWTLNHKNKRRNINNPLKLLETKIPEFSKELNIKPKYIIPIIAYSNATKLEVEPKLLNDFTVVNDNQIIESIHFHKTPKIGKIIIAEMVEKLHALK